MNPASTRLHRALLGVVTAFMAFTQLEASAAIAATLPNPSPRQLAEVERLVARHYVRVIPRDSLEAAARRCFSGGLDPYTGWLDPGESKDFETTLAGKIGGIGAAFQYDTTNGVMRVQALIRGAPAIKAGLQIGDTLVAIDGRPARKLPFDEIISRIRGKPGTMVRLQVCRAGEPQPVERTVRREVVAIPSVRGYRPAITEEHRYLADEPTRTAYIR